jgi:alpha-tubulin suppressor-like RCC1 family protein
MGGKRGDIIRGMRRVWVAAICSSGTLALGAGLAAPASAAPVAGYAWGSNLQGQLGIGRISNVGISPLLIDAPEEIAALAGGERHGLALLQDGGVLSWGNNEDGQLGNGRIFNEDHDAPAPVSGLSEATAIAAGGNHSLALLANGTVVGWGANPDGVLGDGGTANTGTPTAVSGLSEVTAIATGAGHSLALLRNGTVMAWGANTSGELGDDSTEDSDVPVAVHGLSEVIAIAAGGSFSLALLSDGEVRAWGNDARGQLGDGGSCGCQESLLPIPASGLTEVTAIAAGGEHSLALLRSGEVDAWGGNSSGQLGDGTATGSDAPVRVHDLSGVSTVAAGSFYSLALLEGGGMRAWGADLDGELGNGRTGEGKTELPAEVLCSVQGVEGIAAAANTSFAWGAPSEVCPSVTGLSPDQALPSGETPVTITGTEFTGATAVAFGSVAATSFTVESSTKIEAMAPAGGVGVAYVTVTTPHGTSEVGERSRFVYEKGPEYGRCFEVGVNAGGYDKGCGLFGVPGESKSDFEWYPAFGSSKPLEKPRFTLAASGAVTLEASSHAKIACAGLAGSGEYTGLRSTAIDSLALTGCKQSKGADCQSAGAREGEVLAGALDTQLGTFTLKAGHPLVGLELSPASGETLAELSCGTTPWTLRGAVIVEVTTVEKMATTTVWKAAASKGAQVPSSFEGGPTVALSASVGGAGYVPATIRARFAQSTEEAVETNSRL